MEEKLKHHPLVMLVLSCDGYSDLWDEFFDIKDKFWPDCEYEWYLVTEEKPYDRKSVNVVHCGKSMNWAARFRHAVQTIDAAYFGIYLEDYYITDKVDRAIIADLHQTMIENNIDFINVGDVFFNVIGMKKKEYFKEHLILIPQHRKYGVTTEAAIWKREYLLEKLGEDDYSAWQFEIDRCREAKSEKGYGGTILCDDRQPFNVSIYPVVIQGKFYPPAVKFFKKKGITINKDGRQEMSFKQCFMFRSKTVMAKSCFAPAIKWVAQHFFGMKFFT